MSDPVAIPREELEQVRGWLFEAATPAVPFSGNLDAMREEANRITSDRLLDLLTWITGKVG